MLVSEAVRSENPVKPVVTESGERLLNAYGLAAQYKGTYSIRLDECLSVTFVATVLVAYNAIWDVCTWYDSQDSEADPDQDKRRKVWRSIPRVSPEAKPWSGILYTIDAIITRGSGESYHEWRLSDIATAYLQRQEVLVLNKSILAGMLSGGMSDGAVDELKLAQQRLDTFGHDLAKALGAGNGCYIRSWQPVPPSESLPGDKFPKVIQARKVAAGQALLA